MTPMSPDWCAMSKTERASARRLLTKKQIATSIQKEIDAMHDAIKGIRQILFVSGLAVTDLYHDMRRETAFTREETLISPRVRIDERRGTPSFYWEKTVRHAYPLSETKPINSQSQTKTYRAYVRRRGAKIKEKMQVYLLSRHVPVLKKTQSVSMKEFDQEPEWVRTMAALVEPQLSELRQLAKAISDVNCRLCSFERLLKKHIVNSEERNCD